MPSTGAKYSEAEALLPDDLKPIYKKLVEQYEFLTILHFGNGYVAYKVLADLVLAGWRDSGQPQPNSKI